MRLIFIIVMSICSTAFAINPTEVSDQINGVDSNVKRCEMSTSASAKLSMTCDEKEILNGTMEDDTALIQVPRADRPAIRTAYYLVVVGDALEALGFIKQNCVYTNQLQIVCVFQK